MARKSNLKYRQLRSKLIEKGITLQGWATQNGVPPTTVYGAATGERNGVKATKIRLQLEGIAYAN